MPNWLRRTLTIAGLCALAALAHGPVVRAGFSGEDHGLLVRAGAPPGEVDRVLEARTATAPPPLFALSLEDLFAVEGGDGWLLSGLSLTVSRRLWGLGVPGEPVPLGYRIENLFLLGLCALGLHRFLRRLLMPWLGSEQAAAASRTSAALFFLHPLGAATVSSLAARGDLLAFLFFIWTAAAFLRGRQDRKVALTGAAFGGAFLAGLSGDLSIWLPLFLAFVEYASSHRYRMQRDRLRTAATTLVVYGAASGLAVLLRVFETGVGPAPGLEAGLASVQTPLDAAELALAAVEKLGVLVLPASSHGPGMFGTALAGLLFLFACQPALSAARSAPRLWGWLLVSWFVALAIAGTHGLDVRVHPGHLSSSRILFAASAVMCVGLGVSVTAVSGFARRARPWIIVIGFAVLARGNAMPWVEGGQWLDELRVDVLDARERHGRDVPVLVVDPLLPVGGIDLLDEPHRELPYVLHPEFTGERLESPLRVHATTERGFAVFTRQREFEALVDPALLVVFTTRRGEPGRVGPLRSSKLLTPGEASRGTRSWRRELRSPDLDVDALSIEGLVLTAPVGVSVEEPELELRWRPRLPLELEPAERGRWWTGRPTARATIDLSSSVAWRLSGRVRRVWFEGAAFSLAEAQLVSSLPTLGESVEPTAAEDHWTFRLELPEDLALSLEGARGEPRWIVGLLDLATLEYVELQTTAFAPDHTHVPGAAAHVREVVRRTGGPVAWSLDLRVERVTVARSGGRRVGRPAASSDE